MFNSLNLPKFYTEIGHDFVCGMPESDGMGKCANLPPYGHRDAASGRSLVTCNATIEDYLRRADWPPTIADVGNGTFWSASSQCVDWNRYYSKCADRADNPFHGAVSFDDIGHAWIVIFQVNTLHVKSF